MALSSAKTLSLPSWVGPFIDAWPHALERGVDRMRLAIALSAENVRRGTGGPFAAVVWDPQKRVLISAGVNVVVPQSASLAHGEVMALLLAEEALGSHDLGDGRELELSTTSQPCIQCYGAIIWSGVRRVLVGARGSDVETLVGFDEGPVPADWVGQWALRGISTEVDVLRDEACQVLKDYKSSGAPVYNSSANPHT